MLNRRRFVQLVGGGVLGWNLGIPSVWARRPFDSIPEVVVLQSSQPQFRLMGLGVQGAAVTNQLCGQLPGWKTESPVQDLFQDKTRNSDLDFLVFDPCDIVAYCQALKLITHAREQRRPVMALVPAGRWKTGMNSNAVDSLIRIPSASHRSGLSASAVGHTVRLMTDTILKPGLIGIDMADLIAVLRGGKEGFASIGALEDSSRARLAAQSCIDTFIRRGIDPALVSGAFVTIYTGPDVTMGVFDEVCALIESHLEKATYVVGLHIEETWDQTVQAAMVVT